MEANKENRPFPDCVDEEDISESFTCCVCLDLLYKPIVLACGHVSCFWCVHMSMNSCGESSCPICRRSYHHFPSICQMLHFLIVKMYPIAYQRRDNQMLEEEEKRERFSPQFEGSSLKSNFLGGSAISSVPCSKSSSSSECSKLETPECLQDGNMAVGEENNLSQTNSNGALNQISITDALCPTCKELLFRPAVLNCGHAYCETCITDPEDEIIICPVCESPHPSDFPKVCLELNKFLEETFPKEYATQKDFIGRERVDLKRKSTPTCASSKKSDSKHACLSSFPSGDILLWLTEHGPKIHFGVGCDNCGILPIVGDRYKCKDCTEAIGFDLCGECYNTKSKHPGRFNQQHTAEHKFELKKIYVKVRRSRQSLVTESLDYESTVLSTEVSQDSEDGSAAMEFSDNPQEDTEVSQDSEDGSAAMEFSDNPQEDTDSHAEDSTEPNNNSMGDQDDNIQSHP